MIPQSLGGGIAFSNQNLIFAKLIHRVWFRPLIVKAFYSSLNALFFIKKKYIRLFSKSSVFLNESCSNFQSGLGPYFPIDFRGIFPPTATLHHPYRKSDHFTIRKHQYGTQFAIWSPILTLCHLTTVISVFFVWYRPKSIKKCFQTNINSIPGVYRRCQAYRVSKTRPINPKPKSNE